MIEPNGGPRYSSEKWIKEIRNSPHANGEYTPSRVPFGTIIGLPGVDPLDDEPSAVEHPEDAAAELKNRFLDVVERLAQDEAGHVSNLLTLLERQAVATIPPRDAREDLFLGLLEIAAAVAQDETLVQGLNSHP